MKTLILSLIISMSVFGNIVMAQESKIIDLNALLDEIYEIKREQKGRKVDVSDVTEKYIKIGISQNEILKALESHKKFDLGKLEEKYVNRNNQDWEEGWIVSVNISMFPFFMQTREYRIILKFKGEKLGSVEGYIFKHSI